MKKLLSVWMVLAALSAALCVPAGVIMLVLFYRPESKRTPRHGMRRE